MVTGDVQAASARLIANRVERRMGLLLLGCRYRTNRVKCSRVTTELDRLGFGVASGSACTASTLTPSHVLAAMGALTHGNVRLSLTRDTSEADVDGFLAVLPALVERLRAEVAHR